MKRWLILSVVAVFFLMSMSASAEESVKMLSHNYTELEGHNLTAWADQEDWSSAVVSYKNDTSIVQQGKCENVSGHLVCYDGPGFDYDEGIGDWIDNEQYPQLNFTIYGLDPEFTIERDITKKTDFVYDRVKVKVKIRNDGKQRLDGVIYTEDIPESFLVDSVPDSVRREGNELVWKGSFLPFEEETFKYSFKPTKDGRENITGHMTQEGERIEKNTSIITKPSYEYDVDFNETVIPGQEVNYSL
ncbi:MAG: hypothetical protein ACQEP1_04530, partial [Nanobdellota archaeon]